MGFSIFTLARSASVGICGHNMDWGIVVAFNVGMITGAALFGFGAYLAY